jgi:hypothetical protein
MVSKEPQFGAFGAGLVGFVIMDREKLPKTDVVLPTDLALGYVIIKIFPDCRCCLSNTFFALNICSGFFGVGYREAQATCSDNASRIIRSSSLTLMPA